MCFKALNIKNEYRTLIDLVAHDFYTPILKKAISYDRAVGYFSSSSLIQIMNGLVPFIQNGGHIRLVASPAFSKEDIEAIKEGYRRREEIIAGALVRELEDANNDFGRKQLNLLANLIADNKLDIKIALTNNDNGIGIYHEKMGIFKDFDGNTIAFSGSMNETGAGLNANYETIDVFCSWISKESEERTKQKINAFESIWNNSEPNISTFDFPEVKETILRKYMKTKVEYETLDADEYSYAPESVNGNETGVAEVIDKTVPRLPESINLFDYQIKAINSWEDNQFKGIFDMATGTGKTFTGLAAICRIAECLDNKLAVIIVCPYQHLVEQWLDDIYKFGMDPIIGYSASRQRNWRTILKNAIRDQKLHVRGKDFFCFITTYATFSTDFVQEQISKIKGDVLLLADEAHNFGAETYKSLLVDKYKYRLALSATIERYGDESGTKALFDFFGEKCIEYDLERAIREEKLTPYKYYPVLVSLSEAERENYDDLSRKISKCLKKDFSGKYILTEKGKKLALKRARIVAGAIGKLSALAECIMAYKEDSHILVYCGATKPLEAYQDYTSVDDDDLRQIDLVTDMLGNKLGMDVSQFTSKEDIGEREILKQEFSKGDHLQALIAIKCLDEGVNIPKIKVAFILASTTNPKEYIQRRGRVLRKAEGKKIAEIYDFITLPRPLDEVTSLTNEQMKRELTLVKNEICRAEEFARLAQNKVEGMAIIEDIKTAYNLQDYVIEFEEDYL